METQRFAWLRPTITERGATERTETSDATTTWQTYESRDSFGEIPQFPVHLLTGINHLDLCRILRSATHYKSALRASKICPDAS